MNVLVLFATVEGQTGKIARFAADLARALGHSVTLVDVDDGSPVSFDGVEAVILAGPVHQRRHPKTFEVVLAGQKSALHERKTLLLSVSLSAAFPEGIEEAGEYITEMSMRTGFTPSETALVAGAVRTGQYDYFAMQVVRYVVMRDREYDASSGEHEFTDWDALSARISAFLS